MFGLLGPNGAGKTTTILMLLGLTDISGGEVSVLGFDPAREPLEVKRRVGYLPDTVGFYDNLTAAENLRYTARLIGFRFAEREKRIAEALDRVGLADVADKRVGTFSRGMRQRLGLAEILMKGAQIAILDEPTSGPRSAATPNSSASSARFKTEGVSVLLSSHLLERVQSVCDRVALFSAGHIALMGSVPELGREVLGGGYVVDIEADGVGLAERLALIPGVSGVETTGIGKLRLHADRDVRPEAARRGGPMHGAPEIPRRPGAEPRGDLYPLFREPAGGGGGRRARAMRREGSAFAGPRRGDAQGAVGQPHQRAHAGVGVALVLVALGGALWRDPADQEHHRGGSVPVPAAVHDARDPLPSFVAFLAS